MNLFLDTNIYLSFYKLSDDDLEELKTLTVAVTSGATILYVTPQVRDEFNRNRESTIADSLRMLEKMSLPKGFPRLFTNYPSYSALRKALSIFDEQRASLVKEVREDALGRNLHADRLIEELFELGKDIPMTPRIWESARTRRDLGNPPGKDHSYGDAINWESLLDTVPSGENLSIVTSDGDYMSGLESTLLSEFLRLEWLRTKQFDVSAFTNLTALFKQHYPDIRLAVELEKELAINKLIQSESFMQTHAAIRDVSQYREFTPEQARVLVEAANRNMQIRWILDDDDVREFFTQFVREHEDDIDPAQLSEFWEYFEADNP